MEYKRKIEALLISLKERSYDRSAIEKKLGYSENYIDQQLSKGGNKRFYNSLKALHEEVLQKAISDSNIDKNVSESDPFLKLYINSLIEQKRILEVQNDFLRRNFEVSLTSISEGQRAAHSQLKALSWYQALIAVDGDEEKAEEALARMNNKAAWFGGLSEQVDNPAGTDKKRKTG